MPITASTILTVPVIAANRSGVSDTPSFFINDRRHLGPSDFETLLSSIGEAS
jgi:hypothetical protein